MQFARKPRRRPFINIIPLIDVLVVLLIFYIATTVFKRSQPKISIVVPNSTRAAATREATPAIIYVTADSKMYLEDQPVDPDQLGDILKSKLAADPTYKVALKSDTKAPFGLIVKVLDAAHAAGIPNIDTFANPGDGAPGP
jgi:biopolymer transport protein ExbD